MERRAGWWWLVLALVLLAGMPAGAWQDAKETWGKLRTSRFKIPLPDNNYVNDYADLLRPTDVTYLRTRLERLERQTGVEMTVVTVKSVAALGAKNVEELALDFFNSWGVGNRKRNDGLLVLVSREDRRMRIETGSGWGTALARDLQNTINSHFAPHFKKEKYSDGIVAGVDQLCTIISRPVPYTDRPWFKPAVVAVVILVLAAVGVSMVTTGEGGWGYLVVSGIVQFLMLVLAVLLSNSHRRHRRYGWSSSSWGGSSSSSGSSWGGSSSSSSRSSSGSFGGGSSSGRGGASGGW
ncbi:MAG: TPM domain-containing protein [Candidatus Riflebacteria bacterium]|nr:TPM domain-containing protein [Candidatus Riflebacteria bacterium]